jgi:hypothetical protein
LLESIRKYQNILWTLPYLANVRRLKALNDKLKKHNQGHVRRLKALDDQLKKQNQAHVRKPKYLTLLIPSFFLKNRNDL